MRCCRYGVGGIAICGSEKTIVWRDEEDPPALTYPIGASGAIVSDQLDVNSCAVSLPKTNAWYVEYRCECLILEPRMIAKMLISTGRF
jgi:hypothetical protein